MLHKGNALARNPPEAPGFWRVAGYSPDSQQRLQVAESNTGATFHIATWELVFIFHQWHKWKRAGISIFIFCHPKAEIETNFLANLKIPQSMGPRGASLRAAVES